MNPSIIQADVPRIVVLREWLRHHFPLRPSLRREIDRRWPGLTEARKRWIEDRV